MCSSSAPRQFISSYELIAHAKFVMVYNSTVGLESSVLGKPVLCAGKARYTQIPTVFLPAERQGIPCSVARVPGG